MRADRAARLAAGVMATAAAMSFLADLTPSKRSPSKRKKDRAKAKAARKARKRHR